MITDSLNSYLYDAEGRLCAVRQVPYPANLNPTITQYVYDPEGARVAKGTLSTTPSSTTSLCAPLTASGTTLISTNTFTLTTRWLVDQGGQQVTELSVSGSSETWKHSNVFAGGKLTATYDAKGIHFPLTDPLGTKRVQVNALGQMDEYCTSLPFGNDIGNPLTASCQTVTNPLGTGDDATEHHFTQKERDNETGNDYFFARYYASGLGRFTTPDWSAKVVPVPYAQMGDPQPLNLYAYVRNNPLTRIDADGHACFTVFGVTVCIGAPPPLPAPPPTPQAPGLTGEALKDFKKGLATYHPNGGKETVAQIAGHVNGETGGMKDSKSANGPLEKARENIAHVRMNGEAAFGSKVDGLAGMAPAKMSGQDYQACYDATANAAMDNAIGIDPTHGATNMNMRTSMGDKSDFQGLPMSTQSGPFESPSKYKVINTYGP